MSEVKISIPSDIGYQIIPMVVAEKLAAAMGFMPGRIDDMKTAISEIVVPIITTRFRNLRADLMIDITFLVRRKALIIKLVDSIRLLQSTSMVSYIINELTDKIEITATPDGDEIELEFHLPDENEGTGGLRTGQDDPLLMLSRAQETIEQLHEDKELANWFFQNVCNYDIRTPLQSILGYSELLLRGFEGPITEQMRDDLTIIRKKANEIQEVIVSTIRVLDAERIRTGLEEEPATEKVKINQIIQDVRIAQADHLKIDVLPDKLPDVVVSLFGLQQAIIDIVSILSKDNGQGQVVLSVGANEDWGIIRISNPDVSLDNDIMEKIDQIMDETTFFAAQYYDDGLMLSICRYLIELFGGRLELISSEDAGTTATIFLPIAASS